MESAAPSQPTSTASHDLIPESSTAQGDQITTSSVAQGNSLSTNAQVHPPPPASTSDSLHTPTIPRPLDNNMRGRKSFQAIDMDKTHSTLLRILAHLESQLPLLLKLLN